MKKIVLMALAFAFVSAVYAGVTADKPKKGKKTEQCCKKTDACCKKEQTKQ